jgi:hypothetical protein
MVVAIDSTMISELTYKVVAYSVVPNFDTDECVDWAIEMLELGHETETLLILAGLSKPTNYFETIDYLKRSIQELKLEEMAGDKGIFSHSAFFIQRLAKGENIRENLKTIRLYCESKEYEKSIYDFYLLYWAWDDLDYGNECQSYWPNADKNNIEQIVVETAKEWIAENEKHYAQY